MSLLKSRISNVSALRTQCSEIKYGERRCPGRQEPLKMEETKVVTIGRKLTVGEGKRFGTTGCPELELANQWSQQTTGTMHVFAC